MKYNSLMHYIISFENFVTLLKCVPLQPNQIWYLYAFWTVRFHSDCQLPAKEGSVVVVVMAIAASFGIECCFVQGRN